MRTPKPDPKTCKEAAERFREWADVCPYKAQRDTYKGQAEILAMFGDAPVPQALTEVYDFGR